jgi:hypothetical protein
MLDLLDAAVIGTPYVERAPGSNGTSDPATWSGAVKG